MTRNGLYPLFKEMGFTVGCEVGVSFGRNAEEILLSIPGLKLYLVDFYDYENEYTTGNKRYTPNRIRKSAKRRMRRLRRNENCDMEFIIKKSMDAVKDFKDNSLDFVYLDANHSFDYIMMDIIEWSKKVKVGGIICGHDYYRFKKIGVIEAVNTYTNMHKIKPLWLTKDKRRTFFWVKTEGKT